MHGIRQGWLQPIRAIVPALLDYVEARWYGGRAGCSITLDASIPDCNPMARGYARWFDLRQPISIEVARGARRPFDLRENAA